MKAARTSVGNAIPNQNRVEMEVRGRIVRSVSSSGGPTIEFTGLRGFSRISGAMLGWAAFLGAGRCLPQLLINTEAISYLPMPG